MAPETQGNWKRMCFKNNKVWVAVDAAGDLLVDKGRVLIKYQLDQPHEYRVGRQSVVDLDAPTASAAAPSAKPRRFRPLDRPAKPADDPRAIHIYTDGASSGNPGPAGIGVVLIFGPHKKTISRFIGRATNNIAELTAIKAGLEAVKNRDMPVVVYTDSSYALGVLSKGWKARSNSDLVAQIRQLIDDFPRLRFVKVAGHAGLPENEEADRLAVAGAAGQDQTAS
jgi:ribonuclease HI